MRHLVIPDTQIKPDHPIDHMIWAGRYAAAVKPDTIIHLGDHWCSWTALDQSSHVCVG